MVWGVTLTKTPLKIFRRRSLAMVFCTVRLTPLILKRRAEKVRLYFIYVSPASTYEMDAATGHTESKTQTVPYRVQPSRGSCGADHFHTVCSNA